MTQKQTVTLPKNLDILSLSRNQRLLVEFALGATVDALRTKFNLRTADKIIARSARSLSICHSKNLGEYPHLPGWPSLNDVKANRSLWLEVAAKEWGSATKPAHTEEPWMVLPPSEGKDANWHVTDEGDTFVAHVFGMNHAVDDKSKANAERIALCVNACWGLSNGDLQERARKAAEARRLASEVARKEKELGATDFPELPTDSPGLEIKWFETRLKALQYANAQGFRQLPEVRQQRVRQNHWTEGWSLMVPEALPTTQGGKP